MAHLRAPSARADRREGGRHGRPAPRTLSAPPERRLRTRLVRLTVVPAGVVALAGGVAVWGALGPSPLDATGWGALLGALGVALLALLVSYLLADRFARRLHDRVGVLRRAAAREEAELRAVVDDLRRGVRPPPRAPRGRETAAGADLLDLLAADLAHAHQGAVSAVVRAAGLSSQAGDRQKLDVFGNLARRLQSLAHDEITLLDAMESEMEDPDLLRGLFQLDHLATRIRRHAESLAVLGGAPARRRWNNPVPVTEVLRSAGAEVEQYARVRLVPPVDGTLRGHAVADLVHLLAELVENATVFSAPHTQVLLRADDVASGLAIEVEDRGPGLSPAERNRVNALLADPDQVDVGHLLADGHIGLYVVSQLARRHGVDVRLRSNIYGGVQAVLVVPRELLGDPAAGGAVPTGAAPPESTSRQPPRPTTPPPTCRVPADGNPPGVALGATPDDRRPAPEHAQAPPAPRDTAVRDTLDGPALPRRGDPGNPVPERCDDPALGRHTEPMPARDPGFPAALRGDLGRAEDRPPTPPDRRAAAPQEGGAPSR
ncbi:MULTISPECIES: sensor histidine kinase [unclassified Streptomyces]|uniref:sensor histidine kinase n=1 Tax=unclassified Streptomyces TaxID=2593676 RepID=UPI0019031B85|nr:ATP-binding protein [Streptomyces sp. HSG2]